MKNNKLQLLCAMALAFTLAACGNGSSNYTGNDRMQDSTNVQTPPMSPADTITTPKDNTAVRTVDTTKAVK